MPEYQLHQGRTNLMAKLLGCEEYVNLRAVESYSSIQTPQIP